MSSHRQRIQRLFALARHASSAADMDVKSENPPFGFATQVFARWTVQRQQPSVGDVWERFCWWTAGLATAVCVAALVHRISLPEPDAFDALIDAPVGMTDTI